MYVPYLSSRTALKLNCRLQLKLHDFILNDYLEYIMADFKISIATKKMETHKRGESKKLSVVFMQDYENVKQKMQDEIGPGLNEFIYAVNDILKNLPKQEGTRRADKDKFHFICSCVKLPPM